MWEESVSSITLREKKQTNRIKPARSRESVPLASGEEGAVCTGCRAQAQPACSCCSGMLLQTTL